MADVCTLQLVPTRQRYGPGRPQCPSSWDRSGELAYVVHAFLITMQAAPHVLAAAGRGMYVGHVQTRPTLGPRYLATRRLPRPARRRRAAPSVASCTTSNLPRHILTMQRTSGSCQACAATRTRACGRTARVRGKGSVCGCLWGFGAGLNRKPCLAGCLGQHMHACKCNKTAAACCDGRQPRAQCTRGCRSEGGRWHSRRAGHPTSRQASSI